MLWGKVRAFSQVETELPYHSDFPFLSIFQNNVLSVCVCVCVYSESSKQRHINKCFNKIYNKPTEDITNITNK